MGQLLFVVVLFYFILLWYHVINAKEKQATRSGICFSCMINEQTSAKQTSQLEIYLCPSGYDTGAGGQP